MNFVHALGAVTIVGLLTAAGCGSGDELFSGGTPLDGSSSGTDSTTSSSSSSGGGSSSVSSATSSATSSAGGSLSSTSTGGSPPSSSASGGGNGETLDCGAGLTCPVGLNSACCWDQYDQYGAPKAECVTGGIDDDMCSTGYDDSAGLETRIECQREDHCGAADVCCARIAQSQIGNVYVALLCTEYDACVAPGGNDYRGLIVCDTIGSTDGCPMVSTGGGGPPVQGVCKDSQLLPDGYNICGVPGA